MQGERSQSVTPQKADISQRTDSTTTTTTNDKRSRIFVHHFLDRPPSIITLTGGEQNELSFFVILAFWFGDRSTTIRKVTEKHNFYKLRFIEGGGGSCFSGHETAWFLTSSFISPKINIEILLNTFYTPL